MSDKCGVNTLTEASSRSGKEAERDEPTDVHWTNYRCGRCRSGRNRETLGGFRTGIFQQLHLFRHWTAGKCYQQQGDRSFRAARQ
jgi:hypothetical protein